MILLNIPPGRVLIQQREREDHPNASLTQSIF